MSDQKIPKRIAKKEIPERIEEFVEFWFVLLPDLLELKLYFYLQVVFLSYLRSVTMKSFIAIVLSCEKCSSFEQWSPLNKQT